VKTGRTYVGYTVNSVIKRLRKHNGIVKHGGAKSTRKSRPYRLVIYLTASKSWFTKIPAQQLEWALKHFTRRLYGSVRRSKRYPKSCKLVLNKKRSISMNNIVQKQQSWIQRLNTILWLFDNRKQWTKAAPLCSDMDADKMRIKCKLHSDILDLLKQENASNHPLFCDWGPNSAYWPVRIGLMTKTKEQQIENVLNEYREKFDCV
jgi:predicted GIY-YIG superfamily endonuclease